MKLWDGVTGRERLTLPGDSSRQLAVSWSPDGRRLASGGEGRTVSAADRPGGRRKTREGVVVSDKMQKPRVVEIDRVYRHPRYERVVRTSRRVKAHDEANETRVGDRVLLEETRPLSRDKRWRIRRVLSRVS